MKNLSFVISFIFILSGCCIDTMSDNCIEPEMVFVKGGTIVGSTPSNNESRSMENGVFVSGRTVILNDFYIGKYEITQEEYRRIMSNQQIKIKEGTGDLEKSPSGCKKDSEDTTFFLGESQNKRPVENITWYDAVYFCNILSKKANLTPAYKITVKTIEGKNLSNRITEADVIFNQEANGYRLPTEAEWEYAARGADTTVPDWNYFFSGAPKSSDSNYDDDYNTGVDTVGWYCCNNMTGTTTPQKQTETIDGCGTHQVGLKKPNRLGLYDMSGNVAEWCFDTFYDAIGKGTVTNPIHCDGFALPEYVILRGNGWNLAAYYCGVTRRHMHEPSYKDNAVGFRVARNAQ